MFKKGNEEPGQEHPAEPTKQRERPTEPATQRVRWNTANLKSSYANVANATCTREELILNFGINQSWDRAVEEPEIELAHRIILSPFAAKRLSQLLQHLVQDYETRYGEIKNM